MMDRYTPQEAAGRMADTLREYGFTEKQVIELVRFARRGIAAGLNHGQIMEDLVKQPAYKARFPAAATMRGAL